MMQDAAPRIGRLAESSAFSRAFFAALDAAARAPEHGRVGLSPGFLAGLTQGPGRECPDEELDGVVAAPCSAGAAEGGGEGGYPRAPFALHIAAQLERWAASATAPRPNGGMEASLIGVDEEVVPGAWFAEKEAREAASGELTSSMARLEACGGAGHEGVDALRCLLSFLDGTVGCRLLLGLRMTAGSVAEPLPPPRGALLRAFSARHPKGKKPVKLTVGARALCKHAPRSSGGWWGPVDGSEDRKNARALRVVCHLLDHVAWANVHCLPHSVHVVEVRCAEGYGARWSADGAAFRGFLEPQAEYGHQVGWHH